MPPREEEVHAPPIRLIALLVSCYLPRGIIGQMPDVYLPSMLFCVSGSTVEKKIRQYR